MAMTYEGFLHWQDWERYLGTVDDQGLAQESSATPIVDAGQV
jgi:hypothetical protein